MSFIPLNKRHKILYMFFWTWGSPTWNPYSYHFSTTARNSADWFLRIWFAFVFISFGCRFKLIGLELGIKRVTKRSISESNNSDLMSDRNKNAKRQHKRKRSNSNLVTEWDVLLPSSMCQRHHNKIHLNVHTTELWQLQRISRTRPREAIQNQRGDTF